MGCGFVPEYSIADRRNDLHRAGRAKHDAWIEAYRGACDDARRAALAEIVEPWVPVFDDPDILSSRRGATPVLPPSRRGPP